ARPRLSAAPPCRAAAWPAPPPVADTPPAPPFPPTATVPPLPAPPIPLPLPGDALLHPTRTATTRKTPPARKSERGTYLHVGTVWIDHGSCVARPVSRRTGSSRRADVSRRGAREQPLLHHFLEVQPWCAVSSSFF